jgi:hypothetical protein
VYLVGLSHSCILEENGDLNVYTILDNLEECMIAVFLVLCCGKMAVVEDESLSGLRALKLYGLKQRHLVMPQ